MKLEIKNARFSEDEFPRPETSVESLSKLRPAFIKDASGTVTAGNASGRTFIHFIKHYTSYTFLNVSKEFLGYP